jgi:hypothetical protein
VSIPEYARTNFDTLLRAAANGDLALVECTDAVTSEPRYVVAAIAWDGARFVMTPFGHLASGNPYEAYKPVEPSTESGDTAPPQE